MAHLREETWIQTAPQNCFDLARDIGLHCHCAAHSQERAVAGVTRGLIGLGETVTFEAVHFGVRQRLTSRVIEFKPPQRFVDEMISGAFAEMRHTHRFHDEDGGTLMIDILQWRSPLGILGALADKVFVAPHLRDFLRRRNRALKRYAETGSL